MVRFFRHYDVRSEEAIANDNNINAQSLSIN